MPLFSISPPFIVLLSWSAVDANFKNVFGLRAVTILKMLNGSQLTKNMHVTAMIIRFVLRLRSFRYWWLDGGRLRSRYTIEQLIAIWNKIWDCLIGYLILYRSGRKTLSLDIVKRITDLFECVWLEMIGKIPRKTVEVVYGVS